ncbi:MAG TPA: restriction endonuclease subunit S [Candidatus Wunengus sp. YC60]|uniref:restriction endonuclease subunit S n=1 Tax=Candidatus Wunengus sp. YC60 TaxID=3367697 RepID=UPI0040284D19
MSYSIIQKSQLEYDKRIDAEFYEPEYLRTQQLLERARHNTLAEVCDKIINFGAYSLNNFIEYLDSGVPYLFVGDIRDNYIDLSNVKFLDETLSKGLLHKSVVTEGQVLLTIAGTIGNAAVAHNLPSYTNSNQAIANLYPKKEINPYYLATFLNCKYGELQSHRYIISNVQPNLLLTQVKKFIIPIASLNDQQKIENLIIKNFELREQSKQFTKEAEDLLLEELGLKDFQQKEDLSFIVNFSDVQKSNRIDADYFQPKYERLVHAIRSVNGKKLGDLVTMKKGFEPGSEAYQEEGKLFIRVSSLSKFGLEDKDQKCLGEDLYQKLKSDFEPKIGEVLLTKDATPGISYVVKEGVEGIISGGILRLKIKQDIEPEYLALCLNSIIGKMQAERDAGGSIIAHWRPEQIKNLIIPILPQSIQQKIANLVRQSHDARKKSKELLEQAKREVEEMIEKGGED